MEIEEENGIRRWMLNISNWNPSQDQFSSFMSFLPLHEHSAITRFIKFEDRKRALVSRLLQYSLVHEVLDIPLEKIVICRTTEGKPYLQIEENTAFPNFNFSVSHHGDYVGIASESVCLIGLDIISSDIPKNEAVLEFVKNFSSYFTYFEWKSIIGASNSDEILATFYRYWSLKEAFVKAIGSGLGFGLQRLEFHHINWTNITVNIDGVKSRDWSFQIFELDDRHWASVARGHPKEAVGSYNRTLNKVEFNEEDGGFILRSIEQLIPLSDRKSKES